MVRTQIQLTERQVEEIRRIAKAQHVSTAEVIRRAIDGALKAQKSPDPLELRKRAMALAGKFGSGRKDVSREHDAYLAETFDK